MVCLTILLELQCGIYRGCGEMMINDDILILKIYLAEQDRKVGVLLAAHRGLVMHH